jgi:ATP-dependent RNA helicase DDX3X
MAAYSYGDDGGGAWSTVPSRSRRAAPPAPAAPRGGGGGGGDDDGYGAGGLAEAVEGLGIGVGGGERRLDKYDIPVEVSGEGAPPPADGFEAAGLAEAVLRNVARCGYENPTPVQRYAMPIAMAGRDLMACAQTGSGKTAAFCLPVVSGLVAAAGGYGRRDRGSFERRAKPRALVLAPTRELAAQVKASSSSSRSPIFLAV